MEQNIKKENQQTFWQGFVERLIICWYVLTYHTYAVFFVNQSITKKRCCVANNFALFDEAVSKYAENHFQTVNNKDESKNNKDNT